MPSMQYTLKMALSTIDIDIWAKTNLISAFYMSSAEKKQSIVIMKIYMNIVIYFDTWKVDWRRI